MKQRATILAVGALALTAISFGALAQSKGAADSITAQFVMGELQKEGFIAKLDKDDNGEPRLTFKVDGYEWSIYFYACAPGANETRACMSYQFYSGYTPDKTVPLAVINQWNTDKRYARAYNYIQKDGKTSSRVEIDVLAEGTQADRSQTFQAFFQKMKEATQEFRKHIGFTN
jgi:hypothetical protein